MYNSLHILANCVINSINFIIYYTYIARRYSPSMKIPWTEHNECFHITEFSTVGHTHPFAYLALQLLITIERSVICLPAHKRIAHYANERANNSTRKRSARAGRAFCAHFVYICTQQLIVHIRIWYIGSECSHTAPIYRVTCIALFSVVIAMFIADIILPFIAGGKIFHRAQHIWHRFSLHYSLSSFLSLSLPLNLSFSLRLSAFYDTIVCARQRNRETRRSPPLYIRRTVIFICESLAYIPFIRNPAREALSLSSSFSLFLLWILFSFTFAAAESRKLQ